MWGSTAIPSVRIARTLFMQVLTEVIENSADYWVYDGDAQIVAESSFDGNFTVARIS